MAGEGLSPLEALRQWGDPDLWAPFAPHADAYFQTAPLPPWAGWAGDTGRAALLREAPDLDTLWGRLVAFGTHALRRGEWLVRAEVPGTNALIAIAADEWQARLTLDFRTGDVWEAGRVIAARARIHCPGTRGDRRQEEAVRFVPRAELEDFVRALNQGASPRPPFRVLEAAVSGRFPGRKVSGALLRTVDWETGGKRRRGRPPKRKDS